MAPETCRTSSTKLAHIRTSDKEKPRRTAGVRFVASDAIGLARRRSAYVVPSAMADVHSGLISVSLMIGHHLSISAFWKVPSTSGDCCSRGGTSNPNLASCVRTAGSARASTMAALSLAMTSLGVALGAVRLRRQSDALDQFGWSGRGSAGLGQHQDAGRDRRRGEVARLDGVHPRH